MRRLGKLVALVVLTGTIARCAAPPPAAAIDLVKPVCTIAGLLSTLAGKACSAVEHAGSVLKAGKKALGGHLGQAFHALSGSGAAVKALTAGAAVAAIVGWVTGGTKFVLHATASVIGSTTRPDLESTWFSASYWRMSAVSALLTLPFLFAAAIQALMRSDLSMLLRSALGYLPLGLLAVSIAAPLTMLLLSASDELSAIVSSASGNASASFFAHASVAATGLSAISGSTFLAFVVGLLTVAATITLWVELLIRSAAVYVIVLMLPLFFAALVWPARRVWAVRAVEVLVALILSKFVIVAVLSLGGAALGHTVFPSLTDTLEGTTLVMLAAFSPWALLRLLPLHELAGGLDGMRQHARPAALASGLGADAAEIAHTLVRGLPPQLPSAGGADSETGAAQAAVGGLATNAAEVPGAGGDNEAATSPETTSSSALPAPSGASPVPSGASPSASTPEPGAESDPGTAREQRLPGMEPRWQAGNNEWPTVILGLDGVPAPPPAELPQQNTELPPSPPELPPSPPEGGSPAEDHDPRPPSQEPDGGAL